MRYIKKAEQENPQPGLGDNITVYMGSKETSMPLYDYLNIRAGSFGFDSIEELLKEGYAIDGYEYITPEVIDEYHKSIVEEYHKSIEEEYER